MKATIIHVRNGGFVARADSKHWAPLDWSEASGGMNGASSPMEMVLMALGACTAIDVLTILRKARTPPDSLSVELTADRSDAHPRVFTKIQVEYVVKGRGIKPAALERAIKLSEEKYCSVSAMIRDVANISSSFRIET
jgi:putative redox protein